MYFANEEKSYARCVELAVNIFWDVFNNQILQLLNAFPEDHIIEGTGKPFWSGLKKAPSPISLDLNEPIHVDVVQATANIFAVFFGIPMEKDVDVVKNHAKNVEPIKFDQVEISEEDEVQVKKIYEEMLQVATDIKKSPTPI